MPLCLRQCYFASILLCLRHYYFVSVNAILPSSTLLFLRQCYFASILLCCVIITLSSSMLLCLRQCYFASMLMCANITLRQCYFASLLICLRHYALTFCTIKEVKLMLGLLKRTWQTVRILACSSVDVWQPGRGGASGLEPGRCGPLSIDS